MTLSPVLDLSDEGKDGELKEEFLPFNLMSSGRIRASGSTLFLKGEREEDKKGGGEEKERR